MPATLASDNVPLELRTGLDGPKWAAPSGARRSQSRPSQSRLTDAPSKPRSARPGAVQAPLQSTSRRLFSQSSQSTLSASSTPSASSTSGREDNGNLSDGSDTPRPSRHSSVSGADIGNQSFVQDLVPRPPPAALVQDLRHLGQAAAVIASGIAGSASRIVHSYSQSQSQSLSSSHQSPSHSRSQSPSHSRSQSPQSGSHSRPHSHPPSPARSGSTPSGPPSSPPDSDTPPPVPPPPIMPTTLPDPDRIGNLKEIKEFNGSPADLSLFATQVRNALRRKDIPAYNGGCVSGDNTEGYDFVPASTVGCKSNYRLGTNLCSAVSNRLTGAAATWWDDYDCSDKPVPNCWKKASDASHIPANVVEVSLYDLLVQQFDPTVDAQQAELELASYRWNPLEKNALGVIPFRGHVSRLCTRASKTGWAMKGIAIRNTFPDWLRSRVMVSKSEDTFWDEVSACVNTELADRLRDRRDDRKDAGSRDNGRDKQSNNRNNRDKHDRLDRHDRDKQDNGRGGQRRDKSKKCLFCGFTGHEVSDCRRMKAAAVIQQQELQNRDQRDQRDQNRDRNRDRRPATDSRPAVVCYNCNKPGHISTNCPEPKRLQASSNGSVNFVGSDSSPVFLNVPVRFDEQSIIKDSCGRDIELPIYHVLSQIKEKREVFSLPAPDAIGPASGVLHSFTRTLAGQTMLTVWDTGAVYSLVPMSTVAALGLSLVQGSDRAFVAANGSSMQPLGYCTDMRFLVPESTHVFTDKVYVVESAPFQLLLGVDFLNRHWAGVFLPWAQVTLCLPHRVDIACSVQRPQGWQRLGPEVVDELDGISRVVEDVDYDPTMAARTSPVSDTPMLLSMPMEIGRRNLVAELDDPVSTDFRADAHISREFIKGIVNFGPTCPHDVVEDAVDLILQHWDQFSWHEMDLGCIQDVPYDTVYTDSSPCSCKSRRHNYAPRNATLIEAKSRPLVDMGVYRIAGSDVVDRAQLVVVRSKPDEPDNPKFACIAHDFRCKNHKAVLLPVPMATREEMYAFLPKFRVFWKTDADRGFLQIVQAPDAVRHTGFEMFGQLWVQCHGPPAQVCGQKCEELL